MPKKFTSSELRFKKEVEPYIHDNALEIGCGFGDTTAILGEITANIGKRIYAIDPYIPEDKESPTYDYNIYPLSRFKDNAAHLDNLIFIRLPSNDPRIYDILKVPLWEDTESPTFDFAFVDGIQLEENVMEDLILMERLRIKTVCVDDYLRLTDISEVPIAVWKFLDRASYKFERTFEYGDEGNSRTVAVLSACGDTST